MSILQFDVMRMKRLIFFLILLAPVISEASLIGTERSWEFMQSVGGITLGKPDHRGEVWRLPLQCDVSGLQSFTVKSTMLNSALVWADTKTRIENQNILITIETGLTAAGKSPICGPANLGNIKPGKYHVMYRDPDGEMHLVSEIDIGI